MKNFLIALLLISTFSFGQRQRKIIFDADVTTPVDSGYYGVGIVDNQAYLINHRKDSVKFKMEYPYIRSWSTGKDLFVTLNRNSPSLIFCLRDSVTFTLPSPTDTLNKYTNFNIIYLGWRGGTGTNSFVPFDSTCRITFNYQIYFDYRDVTYNTNNFSHLQSWSFFKLYPKRSLTLEIIENKWYLTLKDFDY